MTKLYEVTVKVRIAAPKNEATAAMIVPMRELMRLLYDSQTQYAGDYKPNWTPPTLLEYRIVDAEAK